MKLTRTLTTFAALLLFWNVNAAPTFTIHGGVLTAVELNGATEVDIPIGVSSIAGNVFMHMYSLRRVTIPFGVTSIGHEAFYACTSLSDVNIPDGVETIGDWAFKDCRNLKSISIPSSVTRIGGDAFSGCGFTYTGGYGYGSFAGYYSGFHAALTITHGELRDVELNGATEVIIPDSVTSIRYDAFDDCDELKSVVIPTSVTHVDSGAFQACYNVTNFVMPNTMTCIGLDDFPDPLTIETYDPDLGRGVSVRWSIHNHGELAEVVLNGMVDVKIPSFVTRIRSGAFDGCEELSSVVIPSSVTHIGDGVFRDCHSFASVDGVPQWALKDQTSFGDLFDDTRLTNVVIASGVTNIGNRVFSGCHRLLSVTFPDSVMRVGAGAFEGCHELTTVVFGRSLKNVEEGAFRNCNSVMKVVVPDSVTCILADTFPDCRELTIETYDSTEEYGSRVVWTIREGALIEAAFNGVTDVTFPNFVTSIGDCVFHDCGSLTNITVDAENVNYSSDHGLLLSKDGRTLIRGVNGDVTMPESVTNIGYRSFCGCSGLTNVVTGDGVISIDDGAFFGCNGLRSVTIGKGLTHVGEGAFYCSALTSIAVDNGNVLYSSVNGLLLSKDGTLLVQGVNGAVRIPDSVTGIANRAFSGCSGLTEVTIPGSVTNVGSQVFSSCSGLSLALVPSALKASISKDNQFEDCASGLRIVFYEGSVENVELIVVSFDVNGGMAVLPSMNALRGHAVGDLPEPLREHYRFIGWFTQSSGGEQVTADTVLIGDAMLHAHWESTIETMYTANGVIIAVENGRLLTVELCGATEVIVPRCVTEIGSNAFDGCSNMTSVTISDSVTNIAAVAFPSCASLSLAVLPSELTNAVSTEYPFSDCALDFQLLFYEGRVEDVELISVRFDANGGACTRAFAKALKGCAVGELPVPSRAHYRFLGWFTEAAGGERVTATAVLDGDTELFAHWESKISTLLTYNGVQLRVEEGELISVQLCGATELVIPSCVTNIGYRALKYYGYYECRALTSVTIPDSVTNIDKSAFEVCDNVKSVTISQYVCTEGLQKVFPYAYASITNVLIADGTTSVGDSAFWGCYGLMSVTIPNTVTNIAQYAFAGCRSLSLAFVPSRLRNDVTQNWVFYGCNEDLRIVFYDESDWLTVRFDANDGTRLFDLSLAAAARGCVRGYAIGDLPAFAHPYFLGWFTEPEGGEQVTEDTVLDNSMTLYAHWAPCPILVYAIADSNMAFIDGGMTNNETRLLVVYPNDDGIYKTNLTYWVKDGFEIAELTTNGVKVVEASGKRGEWTLELSFGEAKNLIVVASARLIGSDGLPELNSDVEPDIVAAAMAGVADMGLKANVTNAAQYAAYRTWALALTNETVTVQTLKNSHNTWLSYALGADALIDKELASTDLKIESFAPMSDDGKFEFIVGINGVNIGGGSVAEEMLKANLKKVLGLEGGTSLEDLSAGNVDITFDAPIDGKVKFSAGPNAANVDATTFFMKVRLK